jgi:hypothetical protein
MSKLKEYVYNKAQESLALEEEEKRNRINFNIAKSNYKEKFNHLINDKLRVDLLKLVDYSYFDVIEKNAELETEPLILQFELNITVNKQIAQYFLSFSGNSITNPNSFSINIESSGFEKSLPAKEILFDDLAEFNIEDFLIQEFKEFEK